MTSPRVEVSFDNLLSEHLAAERLYYRSTFLWKLDKFVAILLACVGGYLTYGVGLRWWTAIWFPLGICEWFNLLSIRPLQIWYWFTHNPKFRDTYHLTFEDSFLHFRTSSMDSRIQWDHFSSVLEDDRLFLLVYGTRMYSLIPKRAFKSEAELREFRAIVDAKVGSAYRPA